MLLKKQWRIFSLKVKLLLVSLRQRVQLMLVQLIH
ncbi:Uncharacterised protein [Acinetobacter baumannii]|nr:Uncharacterised protein [Acinetobacter baumannii]